MRTKLEVTTLSIVSSLVTSYTTQTTLACEDKHVNQNQDVPH